MSEGKYLSLEEARKGGKIKRFCKEHPSKGVKGKFDKLFDAMASGTPPEEDQTSDAETSED